MEELQKAKVQVLEDIKAALPDYMDRLNAVDGRLLAYIEDAISNDGSHANLYELLGIRKELRLMDSYEMNPQRVQMVLRAIEGVWKDGKHVKGGLEFDTARGNMHVQLMPYQVWCVMGIYLFVTDVNMQKPFREGDALLPTEFVKDGNVWDKRRLCTEAHIFQTRKSGKTEFGAAIDFTEACFLGEANSQVLICSNSKEQSDIAMKAIKEFAYQVDPTSLNRMGGKFFSVTASKVKWQPGNRMKGEIRALTAGGKASRKKDGLYASIVHADEHGSAVYVNGASDMQSLVEVAWGSTGPRREKLLLHTTTAGLTHEGPYKNQLEQVQKILLSELEHPLGVPYQTFDDKWFAFLLQLDPWELTYNLEQLDNEELFHKVNRSIGTTVQPTYYRERLHDAKLSEDTLKEVMTKDFNIWQTVKTVSWLVTPAKVRRLQINRRVTDCLFDDGWQTFVGLDFGGNDDFMAISTLSVNYMDGLEMKDRFFADTIAWINEAALKESPNRALYELWIEQGWVKVCPGEVFDASLAVNELMQLAQSGINLFMFGYDPAQSKDPINNIQAWLQSLGCDPENMKNMLVPVRQDFMTMNQILLRLEYMTLSTEPWLRYSMSPLWPWMAGNAAVTSTRDDTLRKIVKSGEHNKVDCFHGLLDALYCFDLSEGKIGG